MVLIFCVCFHIIVWILLNCFHVWLSRGRVWWRSGERTKGRRTSERRTNVPSQPQTPPLGVQIIYIVRSFLGTTARATDLIILLDKFAWRLQDFPLVIRRSRVGSRTPKSLHETQSQHLKQWAPLPARHFWSFWSSLNLLTGIKMAYSDSAHLVILFEYRDN